MRLSPLVAGLIAGFAHLAAAEEQGSPLVVFKGHPTPVVAVAISEDGTRAISACGQNLLVWEPASGKQLDAVKLGSGDPVDLARASLGGQIVAFSRDLKLIAISRFSGITIYSAADGRKAKSIEPHGDWNRSFPFRPAVTSLAFSPDGKTLASAASIAKVGGRHGLPGGVVKVWNVETGKVQAVSDDTSSRPDAVAFSDDGKLVAGGTQGAGGELPEPGEIAVSKADSGERLHTFKAREAIGWDDDQYAILSLAFDPKNARLAAAYSDGAVRVWKLPSDKPALVLKAHKGKSSTEQVDPFTGLVLGNRVAVKCVAFSPDGKRIAAAGFDRAVRMWNAESGEEVYAFRFDVPEINAITFSADGKRLIAGGGGKDSGQCAVWQLSE